MAALSSSSWNLPNDELALINRLTNLESSWKTLDLWLKFWILLVVIGVATEIVVILYEYFRDLRDFSRGIIHSPDKPSIRLLVFALTGAGLVAIGVAGEFFIHIKAGRVETDMRDITGHLVALANERASENEKEAAILQERIVEMGPRNALLYGTREKNLVDAITAFGGQSVMVLDCRFGPYPSIDPEINDVIKRLQTVLSNDARWNVIESKNGWSETGKGIWLGTEPNATKRTVGASKALLEALAKVPLYAEPHKFPKFSGKQDLVLVVVCTNPARPAQQSIPVMPPPVQTP